MDVSKSRGIVDHSSKRAVANRELTESMQVLLDLQPYRILKNDAVWGLPSVR